MKKWFLIFAALPFLAGCISDGASIQLEGRDDTVSVIREQKWIWDETLDLFVVASRMPQCQRRHRLARTSISRAEFEAFLSEDSVYILRQGTRLYRFETQTCERFETLTEAPAEGLGTLLGTFRAVDGAYRFIPAPAPTPAAAAGS